MKCERHLICLDKLFRAAQATGMIYYFTLTNDNFQFEYSFDSSVSNK